MQGVPNMKTVEEVATPYPTCMYVCLVPAFAWRGQGALALAPCPCMVAECVHLRGSRAHGTRRAPSTCRYLPWGSGLCAD